MAGVGLVGYSGSLIKDAVKEPAVHLMSSLDHPVSVQDEGPEVTRVVIGAFIGRLVFFLLMVHQGVFFVLFAQILYVYSPFCLPSFNDRSSAAMQFVIEGTLRYLY